jgi:hypothetical protein
VHVQTDEPGRVSVGEDPGLLRARSMSRVAEYVYAAPGGLDALVVGEFAQESAAVKAAGGVSAGAGREPVTTVFRQISPPSGWLTARGIESGPERPRGTAVLSVVMDVDSDALTAFHGWYDEEHLPKLVSVPGILCALRYEALTLAEAPATARPSEGRVRFLAWYEMADQSVVDSDAFAAASVLTPRTAQVTAHLAWASQLYVEG